MELNHSFAKKELSTDDNNFKPFTGELPSKLQAFAERALARYEKMSPIFLEHFKPALVCIDKAVLRTTYMRDLKRPSDATDPEAQARYDAEHDPIFKLKHAI